MICGYKLNTTCSCSCGQCGKKLRTFSQVELQVSKTISRAVSDVRCEAIFTTWRAVHYTVQQV